ncbi:hypothetical protein RDV89_11425 [Nocardioides zeae]|uniref:Uncharacterized protein n=1 Tax=Nocardioides imazamoxiresistens TaxID=3231893 RepID=A0ABU3PWS4_9ACTN|nr:hypothetical protein [Nocardioides zeae]MDT9593681.1 hypothetical protein [Nocardioides zeae]
MAAGRRAGTRHAGGGPSPRGRIALHALAITVTVVAWGYLAWLAVDFGATARRGEGIAWLFLALATLGAIACLFIGLLLGAAVLRLLNVTRDGPADDAPPRPAGGKRRAG